MRYISDSSVARQVQPVDFSFLSEADMEIVKGVEAMIRTMCGFTDENVPIILSGVWVDLTSKPMLNGEEQTTVKITEGKILSGGYVVDFDEISIIKPSYSYDSLLETVRWMKRLSTISPSPVKNEAGEEKINCHHLIDSWTNQATKSKPTSNASAGLWVLSDMYRVYQMPSLDAFYELENRISALENFKTLTLTKINSL